MSGTYNKAPHRFAFFSNSYFEGSPMITLIPKGSLLDWISAMFYGKQSSDTKNSFFILFEIAKHISIASAPVVASSSKEAFAMSSLVNSFIIV